jgi:tetratricopeptide (TPR) repeat protein
MANLWISANPDSSGAYFGRHQAWLKLGEPEKAIQDLTKSIALAPSPVDYKCRGNVYRQIGQYAKALEDYSRGEAMDPQKWQRDAFPLIYQADTYARLGDETKALACCARLPDHFWTPGHNQLPPGGKADIADELKRRAAAARRRSL